MDTYTPYQLMDILHLSKTAVYQLIAKGEIRIIRVGRKILVSESDLREFLERRKEGGTVNAG